MKPVTDTASTAPIPLTRKKAMASPLSKEAFAIVDRIVEADDRTEPWFRGVDAE